MEKSAPSLRTLNFLRASWDQDKQICTYPALLRIGTCIHLGPGNASVRWRLEVPRSSSGRRYKQILRELSPSLYCTILYFTSLYHTILYYTILLLYYTIPYYTILYYTILYYNILYYIILYHTILYYTALHYTILYYTILYYTILYYTIL